ncbi:SNF2-related protein [Desulfurispira natronophila]|uniref:Superfamily II DNA or RNA helicase n=1 Tax=Desulfurispira natronophila TaxID=682562 RepID=A0A7W7Y594_9BACT|nr:SNF2-related protein [Desulfurispira natronophila]MBB5022341.1 superfamily II DNA or RNA helicase [Desulfurispira natronophila]
MEQSEEISSLAGWAGIGYSNLKKVFTNQSIQRGYQYWKNGKVLLEKEQWEKVLGPHQKDSNVLILRAKVTGTWQYSTVVVIAAGSRTVFNASCSCPVGSWCKHSVATLLEFGYVQNHRHERPKVQQDRQVAQWLLSLTEKKTAPTSKDPSTAVNKTLIYLLDPVQDSPAYRYISVFVCEVNILKSGLLGKRLQYLPLRDMAIVQDYVDSFTDYSRSDKTILRQLRGARIHNGAALLTEEEDTDVLHNLFSIDKAYWCHPQEWDNRFFPVIAAEDRTLSLSWKHDTKSNSYQLRYSSENRIITDHFLIGDTLYYFDGPGNCCGTLHYNGLSGADTSRMLMAPTIPAAMAKKVSKELLKLFPNTEIPTPATVAAATIVDVYHSPVARLRLHCHAQTPSLYVASLRFVYGDHELDSLGSEPTVIIHADGQRKRIYRDLDFEIMALSTLQELGFTSTDGSDEHLGPLDMVARVSANESQLCVWAEFLEKGVEQLKQEGWQVEHASGFSLQIDDAGHFQGEIQEHSSGWFDLSLGFEVGDLHINLLPTLIDVLHNQGGGDHFLQSLEDMEHVYAKLDENRWIRIESSRIQHILHCLSELYNKSSLNKDGSLTLSRPRAASLGELLEDEKTQWQGARQLQEIAHRLSRFSGIKPVEVPQNLQATLRDYQHKGLDWLQFLREYGFSGILADDMGLGKTLQVLACLQVEKNSGRGQLPSLVIAPTSLMSNWRNEALRFAPDLRVCISHGSERHQQLDNLADYDLVVTTYPLINRDSKRLAKQPFHYVILDEAQYIKNANTKTTRLIGRLEANHRLCLTGTPMENHLGELWSMFNFLMPGFLGTQQEFTRIFRNPIEKQHDTERQQQLRQRVTPFMLRRTKQEVAQELPAKTEIVRTVALQGKQRDLYESVRLAMDQQVRKAINQQGFNRSQITILDALLKLRQTCCDPRLVKLEQARSVKQSAKMDLLMSLLQPMVAEERKILIFSQFTTMLGIIENELIECQIPYTKLTGQTRKRDEAIDRFQNGDARVFLIALKAGGTGLNLTAADTVIHYDPWWNPAAENQATDRAHRIGQDKPVFVYKLLTEQTVEEKILNLQQRKQSLADSMYGNRSGEADLQFNADDLMNLLQPLESES